jgi:hypothetical protein
VADGLRKLRELYRYQLNCLEDSKNVSAVHQTIADSTIVAHAELQDCLSRVLVLEGWDRTTLSMPEGLRIRQMNELLSD